MISEGYDEYEADLIIKISSGDIQAEYDLAVYYYDKNKIIDSSKFLNGIITRDKNIIGSKANIKLGDIDFDQEAAVILEALH